MDELATGIAGVQLDHDDNAKSLQFPAEIVVEGDHMRRVSVRFPSKPPSSSRSSSSSSRSRDQCRGCTSQVLDPSVGGSITTATLPFPQEVTSGSPEPFETVDCPAASTTVDLNPAARSDRERDLDDDGRRRAAKDRAVRDIRLGTDTVERYVAELEEKIERLQMQQQPRLMVGEREIGDRSTIENLMAENEALRRDKADLERKAEAEWRQRITVEEELIRLRASRKRDSARTVDRNDGEVSCVGPEVQAGNQGAILDVRPPDGAGHVEEVEELRRQLEDVRAQLRNERLERSKLEATLRPGTHFRSVREVDPAGFSDPMPESSRPSKLDERQRTIRREKSSLPAPVALPSLRHLPRNFSVVAVRQPLQLTTFVRHPGQGVIRDLRLPPINGRPAATTVNTS